MRDDFDRRVVDVGPRLRGATLLDDPNDEILLPDGGHRAGSSSGGEGEVDASVNESDGGSSSGGSSSSSGSSGSSSGSSPGTVACGTQTCDSESEDCCTSLTGMATGESCVAKGKCTGIVTACMGTSDCSEGDVCCVSLGGAGGGLAGGALAGGALAGGALAGGGLAGTAGGLGVLAAALPAALARPALAGSTSRSHVRSPAAPAGSSCARRTRTVPRA